MGARKRANVENNHVDEEVEQEQGECDEQGPIVQSLRARRWGCPYVANALGRLLPAHIERLPPWHIW